MEHLKTTLVLCLVVFSFFEGYSQEKTKNKFQVTSVGISFEYHVQEFEDLRYKDLMNLLIKPQELAVDMSNYTQLFNMNSLDDVLNLAVGFKMSNMPGEFELLFGMSNFVYCGSVSSTYYKNNSAPTEIIDWMYIYQKVNTELSYLMNFSFKEFVVRGGLSFGHSRDFNNQIDIVDDFNAVYHYQTKEPLQSFQAKSSSSTDVHVNFRITYPLFKKKLEPYLGGKFGKGYWKEADQFFNSRSFVMGLAYRFNP